MANTGTSNSCAESFCVCFVTGTRILTDRGEVAVEQLREGDLAVLESGERAAIKWLGWRTIPARLVAEDEALAPVRIVRGAFGPDRPHRDLWVSGDHAIAAHGVIIPAKALINGLTILRDRTEREVTYHHVELDQHALLLAEGLAAESYLEWEDNRSFFANSTRATSARPDLPGIPDESQSCAPRVSDGPVVEEVKRLLLARARELRFDAPLLSPAANCWGGGAPRVAVA